MSDAPAAPRHNGGPNSTRRRAAPIALAALEQLRRRGGVRLPGPDDDPIDTYLIATHETLTMEQQAEALGVSRHTLGRWRERLYAQDRITVERRAGMARISAAETQAIARLWAQGLSGPAIAERRGISRHRVDYCLKLAGALGQPRAVLISGAELARLFNVSSSLVVRWVRRGWMPTIRTGRDDRASSYGWTRDDLEAFIANRETWVAWAPAQLADPALHARARALRAAAGGQWHQFGALFQRIGISRETGSRWTLAGLFGARPQLHYGSSRFVWLTVSEAALLERLGEPIRLAARDGSQAAEFAAKRQKPLLFAALAEVQR